MEKTCGESPLVPYEEPGPDLFPAIKAKLQEMNDLPFCPPQGFMISYEWFVWLVEEVEKGRRSQEEE